MVLDGSYQLKRKVGSGTFGVIYIGIDNATGAQVAIKVEPADAKYPQLYNEVIWYQALQAASSSWRSRLPFAGFPMLHGYDFEGDHHNIMVMDLLGPSLDRHLERCAGRFQPETVVALGSQMLECVEYVHSRGIVHRDIKPNNFAMGYARDARSRVHIIDFGLAKPFKEPGSSRHIPYNSGLNFVGTARYASVWALRGEEQSRRDDLFALGYVLVYFLRGRLPWQNLQAEDKAQRRDLILDFKERTSHALLCGPDLPNMKAFLDYCASLSFEARPDYAYLQELLAAVLPRSMQRTGQQPMLEWIRANPDGSDWSSDESENC